MKQSVKTSEGVLRSAGVQQNKNSGTRVANQTVDTTTNEGSKTMGRGFLIQTISPPLIFLGGMLGAARQKLCFPVFSPRSQNRTAVVIRGDCGVMGLPLAVRTVTPRGAYGRVFFLLLCPSHSASLRSPTCYQCEQRLHLLFWYIFTEQVHGIVPVWKW